jgi:hypothetical protein
MESASGGPDFTAYPRFYIPYSTAARDAAARGEPLAALAQKGPAFADAVARLVNSTGKPAEELVFLPLRTRSGEMAIVLGKPEGEVIGVLPVNPR